MTGLDVIEELDGYEIKFGKEVKDNPDLPYKIFHIMLFLKLSLAGGPTESSIFTLGFILGPGRGRISYISPTIYLTLAGLSMFLLFVVSKIT
jgi:hypothetical protein